MVFSYLVLIIFNLIFAEVLKIEKVFDISIGKYVFEIGGFCVDDNGNIFVSDKADCSIKKFDKSGNFINKVGKKGGGPGEFRGTPGKIIFIKDLIAVIDVGTPFIYLFSADLKYLKTLAAPAPIFDIGTDGIGKLYAVYVNYKNFSLVTEIAVYNKIGELLKTFQVKQEYENPFLGFAYIQYFDQGLVLCYPIINKILILDLNGVLVKEISIKELPVGVEMRPLRKIPIEIPEHKMFLDIDFLMGHILVLGGKYSKNPWKDIYIIDSSGNLIQVLTLPEQAHFIESSNGYLYTAERYSLYIRKYRVELQHKSKKRR
ncbi:hypothetical protein JGI23_00363 [Candidatus Chrysopegis kryptomonas]|jgi:hypothetical protein|uniref:NHL repeat-containing protein n=1 Tax=Candidatus Chryseopegocella kryptomonas TaxID=1633643 RepID=A0A0P1MPY2_9BACT|nr:hypothetical protein JGI23_00363 [Candidatus Chrysopegis kryptomonas]